MIDREPQPERHIAEQGTLREFCGLVDDLLVGAGDLERRPTLGVSRTYEGGLFGVSSVHVHKHYTMDEKRVLMYKIDFIEKFPFEEDPLVVAKNDEYRVFVKEGSNYEAEHEIILDDRNHHSDILGVAHDNVINKEPTDEDRSDEDQFWDFVDEVFLGFDEKERRVNNARNIGLLAMYEDEAQQVIQKARILLAEGEVRDS